MEIPSRHHGFTKSWSSMTTDVSNLHVPVILSIFDPKNPSRQRTLRELRILRHLQHENLMQVDGKIWENLKRKPWWMVFQCVSTIKNKSGLVNHGVSYANMGGFNRKFVLKLNITMKKNVILWDSLPEFKDWSNKQQCGYWVPGDCVFHDWTDVPSPMVSDAVRESDYTRPSKLQVPSIQELWWLVIPESLEGLLVIHFGLAGEEHLHGGFQRKLQGPCPHCQNLWR